MLKGTINKFISVTTAIFIVSACFDSCTNSLDPPKYRIVQKSAESSKTDSENLNENSNNTESDFNHEASVKSVKSKSTSSNRVYIKSRSTESKSVSSAKNSSNTSSSKATESALIPPNECNNEATEAFDIEEQKDDEVVVIPEYATELDGSDFAICLNAQKFKVDEDNPVFCDIDGVIYSKDHTEIIKVPAKYADSKFTVPKHVTKVGEMCFTQCKGLNEIVLPDGLKEIEEFAFTACNIKSIVIPKSVEKVGHTVFLHCNKLTDIYVGWNETKPTGWDRSWNASNGKVMHSKS